MGAPAPLWISLHGDLGAGKTSFTQELVRHWGGFDLQVQSPTFLKVLEYRLPDGRLVLHLDGYRLHDDDDIEKLALEQYAETDVWIVEWPEKIESFLASRPELTSALGIKTKIAIEFSEKYSPERARFK